MSILDIKDSAAIWAAIAEFDRLGRTYFLEKYGFGRSREYMLRNPSTGQLYDSKAIVGVAYGYAFPEHGSLSAEDFSGGEATVHHLLTSLGFEVLRVGQEWSEDEVLAAVEDYFEMLRLESRGESYNKAEHNQRLQLKLPTRSRGSIELKHQNISAILDQIGLPYIPGYKPRSNFQGLLRDAVIKFVKVNHHDFSGIVDDFESRPEPVLKRFTGVLVDVPQPEAPATPIKRERLPRKLDFASRDEQNRRLGHLGESWVVGFETQRLNDLTREDLSARIDWTSNRLGDGAGYDIMSFEQDEQSRFIEVKTTAGGSLTPFIISQNELDFSEEFDEAFCLYRVFEFAKSPRLFILRGALSRSVQLEPIDYRARLRAIKS